MLITLNSSSLKPFTRALTCLSKYSDELVILATRQRLSLSATNSSESAYCRFNYSKQFFSKYSVGSADNFLVDNVEETSRITGQLLTRSLLTILKHRAVEKTVDRCELSIIEGDSPPLHGVTDPDEEVDSLESRLVVRLHCKHGVIKTHRLPLQNIPSVHTYDASTRPAEFNLSIGPKALKDIIEHFPSVKGNKGDPQLVWSFGESDVQIKSLGTSFDTKGKTQLMTELTIHAGEFEDYQIHETPVTVAFQLREFNATVAFADSMLATLNLRFTKASDPLVIELECDDTESLFVISTNHPPGAFLPPSQQSRQPSVSIGRKRQREDDEGTPEPTPKAEETASIIRKPMKVVKKQSVQTVAKSLVSESQRSSRSMPPPSLPLHSRQELEYTQDLPPQEEPLFLPGTQMSVEEEALIRSTGLGIENMTREEIKEMLEDEGEEYEIPPSQRSEMSGFALFDDMEMEPTQTGDPSKAFQPLFED